MNDFLYENMKNHEKNLSIYACPDEDAIYLQNTNKDIRTPFFKDTDKILYSLCFARYSDKTQVFIASNNDHIQKRMLHVQYVSKIARTIGRALGLNEDLIEAASLGHDLGHTPFGHLGEKILNKISLKLNEGHFYHNVNSVRNLLFLENNGNGLNISIQVLDAIMCHNGELVSNEYYPKKKTQDDFLKEYFECKDNLETEKYLRPMTLEGCVVRISDVIAYIGRDIEDAVRLNFLTFDDIPNEVKKVLGTSNSEIVNTIVNDIIKNSINKNYLKLSDDVFNALKILMDFNYQNIYLKSISKEKQKCIEDMFEVIIKNCINDIKSHNENSRIYQNFLNNMNSEYLQNTPEKMAIDYVAGMTDDYFKEEYEKCL